MINPCCYHQLFSRTCLDFPTHLSQILPQPPTVYLTFQQVISFFLKLFTSVFMQPLPTMICSKVGVFWHLAQRVWLSLPLTTALVGFLDICLDNTMFLIPREISLLTPSTKRAYPVCGGNIPSMSTMEICQAQLD